MLAGLLLACSLGACSDDDDDKKDDPSFYYDTYGTSTLISAFSLGSNDKVLYHLDSVFFAIDQDRCLIYNVDSLPVGTDVTKLTVSATFPSSVRAAQFHVTGGKVMRDTTFSYSSTTADSIDFTGHVQLAVTSLDGNHTRTYTIKVNVHNVEPDSLNWEQRSRRDIPNVNTTLQASKAVQQGDTYYILAQDGNGYELNSATHPGQGQWENTAVDFGFTPQVGSFTATSNAFYVLDQDGALYRSTGGATGWTACGVKWHSILGGYGARVLGIVADGDTYKHDEYPRPAGFSPAAVPASFPVSDASPLTMASNEWTASQQAMMLGGRTASGKLTRAVWGYDGQQWGEITDPKLNLTLPAVADAVIVPYYTYSVDTATFKTTQRIVWLMMGGMTDEGLNTTTYISYNQGISWSQAGKSMQLPSYITPFWQAQAFVVNETLSAKAPRRKPYTPSGQTTPVTEWQCPYIYLVGGRAASGAALGSIWRGVVNRLQFKPIY